MGSEGANKLIPARRSFLEGVAISIGYPSTYINTCAMLGRTRTYLNASKSVALILLPSPKASKFLKLLLLGAKCIVLQLNLPLSLLLFYLKLPLSLLLFSLK